jgi:hypothetical protein
VRTGRDERRSESSRLAETPDASAPERFCVLLADAGIEFMVIGGQAEALMGSARVTYDVDLCDRRTPENLERLAAALRTLKLTLRGAPPGPRRCPGARPWLELHIRS